MSSTNRTNAKERHVSDYYVTPQKDILDFFEHWVKDECEDDSKDFISLCRDLQDVVWRDPCAGGDINHEMSYPAVLEHQLGAKYIETIDIREDSLAETKGDFLAMEVGDVDITITNPPFNLAQEIIEKALATTQTEGFVIMLLRLNFMGSKTRKPFWDKYPAHRIYVHHKRLSFKEDGGTDSIEYAHFVWKVGKHTKDTTIKII